MSTLKIVKVILSRCLTTPIWFYSTFQAHGALWELRIHGVLVRT